MSSTQRGPDAAGLPPAARLLVYLPARRRRGDIRCALPTTWSEIPMKQRQTRRSFMGLAGAGLAGMVHAPAVNAQPATRTAADTPEPDLIVTNAKVYTMDSATPRAEAFAIKGWALRRRRQQRRHQGSRGQGTRDHRREADDHRPRIRRLPQSRRRQTLLYEVLVGNPFEVEFVTIQSIIEKLRAKAQTDAARRRGSRAIFFDDTKVKDKRELNVTTSTRYQRNIRSSSVTVAGIRLLQHVGDREGGRDEEHAESARRDVRQATQAAS